MKSIKMAEARALRVDGYSMNYIQKKLMVSKSSVSRWVGNIKLNITQKQKLAKFGSSNDVVERRRTTRLYNENTKRQTVIDLAKKDIKIITDNELKLIGTALYWAEGGKTQRMVRFSNSDPSLIKIMMKFFRKICKVREGKFRGVIHIHPHLDYKKAEKYWSGLSGIPLKQFYKTYRKMNVAAKHKRDNLPLGTFDVYICDTQLFLKISGWMAGIFDRVR